MTQNCCVFAVIGDIGTHSATSARSELPNYAETLEFQFRMNPWRKGKQLQAHGGSCARRVSHLATNEEG